MSSGLLGPVRIFLCSGRPFRLDVTKSLKNGVNTVKIEPFAPKSVRLVVLGKDN